MNISIEKWQDEVALGETLLGYEAWAEDMVSENPCAVSSSVCGIINESFIFYNPDKAKVKFLEMCNGLRILSEEETEDVVNDGAFEMGETVICLYWPVVIYG